MAIDVDALVDALPGLVWTTGADGCGDFVNRRWRDYTGLDADEPCGRGWQSALHPDDLEPALKAWEAIRTTGIDSEIEVRLRRFDGEYRWFAFRLSRLSEDGWCWLGLDADETGTGPDRPTPDGRLRRLMDMLPAQILFMTPSMEVEFVNREVLEFYGKTLEELSHWDSSGAIHPDDLPDVFDRVERLLRLGETWDFQNRMRRADGTYRWVRSRMVPSRNAQGDIVRYCSIQTDVHDLKQAEHLLAGEVRLLEMVALSSPLRDVLEALSRLVEEIAIGCFCSILTVSPDRKHFQAVAGPSLPEEYNAMLDGLRIDPGYGPCSLAVVKETPVITADPQNDPRWAGSTWPVLMQAHKLRSCWSVPIASSSGEVSGIFAIYRREPVSPTPEEQQLIDRFTKIAGIAIDGAHADEALMAREADLRQAYDHLTEAQRLSKTGSFTWDVAADQHNWSGEIRRIFGFNSHVQVSMGMIQAAVHPDDMAEVERVIGGAAEGRDFDLVFRILTTAGELRHAHVVGHRIRRITDRPVFLGAMQDVTERVVGEEALNRARMQLAHVSRVTALSALTASIAHEVNQPLAGIVTNASTCLRMLANDPPDTEGARATAQRTIRDANRASEVIKRLRALFARRQPGVEPVDLNDAAREVLNLSSGELQGARVSLQTQFADDLPTIPGDRVQLQQVILNLVLNAAEAMRGIDDRAHDLRVSTARDGDGRVLLSVRDSGVGAPAGQLEQLFDAFYTTRSDGMGVGLSISRTIIEAHGGRLWASGNDGPGLTFSASLPVGAEDGDDMTADRAAAGPVFEES